MSKHFIPTDSPSCEVCLYGNREVGFGWIANSTSCGMLGTGEPSATVTTLTDATFRAISALLGAGVSPTRIVRVFEPSGLRCADVRLDSFRTFGDLTWETAPTYELSVEDILKHGEAVE